MLLLPFTFGPVYQKLISYMPIWNCDNKENKSFILNAYENITIFSFCVTTGRNMPFHI